MGLEATYNMNEIEFLVAGVPISGGGENDFLSVGRDEDSFTKMTGADGEVVRSKTNNLGGRITVTLRVTSPANGILQGMALTDEVTGAVVVPVNVRVPANGLEIFAEEAWLLRMPNIPLGKTVGEVQWVFDCAALRQVRLDATDYLGLDLFG